MDAHNWQQVKDIFAEALETSNGRRLEFLRERCGANETLFAEVKSLLAANEETEPLIEKNALQLASKLNGKNYDFTKFGRYTVIREIGRGGMGAVFLAERNDGEFEQRAALKIIRQSFTDDEIERHFRRERQILASLNHPNIAKLLDGGVSDAGELFLVMEYVAGESLNEYAGKNQLSVEERLRLFLKICRAVSYAHQNLVVHRDLKPSNILITKDGEPKLLDFGLAKITAPNEGGENDFEKTKTFFRAFTPAYASPEQIHGNKVTTASDVYSLGVILYELLTGAKPFYFDGKSFDEILKTIDFTEPPRPSAAVGKNEKQYSEQSEPKSKIQKPKSLKGDLDNITLKALRKEPARRYKSVEAFADDIERHLKNLPINARPNTISYRASRFLRRNRVAVSATAFVMLALISGLAVALWQARVARAERDRAEQRFADVRELSNALLFKIAPKIERLEGSIKAREILVSESLKYLDNLASESASDAGLQSELASAYEKIGDLQGAPRQPNLSDFSGAAASYEKARTIRRKLLETNPNDAENHRLLALNYAHSSSVYYWTNDLSRAMNASETALQIYADLIAAQPERLDLQVDPAAAEIEYANIFFFNSQFDRFYPLLQKTLARLEDLQNRYPDDAEIQGLIGKSRTLLGSALSWDEKQAEGEAEMKRALEIGERLAARSPNDNRVRQGLLQTYWEAAAIHEEVNDRTAYEYLLKALKICEESARQDAADGQARENLAMTFYRLGAISSNLKRNEQSLEYLEKARAIFTDLQQNEPKNQTYKMNLGRIYIRFGAVNDNRGEWQNAVADYQKAAAVFQEVTESETQNKAATRYLAGQYIYIADIYAARLKKADGENQAADKSAAVENYQKALGIFGQLEKQNALSEYDRKYIEKARVALKNIQS